MCERERAAERARCLPFSFLLDASNLDNRETQPPPLASPPLETTSRAGIQRFGYPFMWVGREITNAIVGKGTISLADAAVIVGAAGVANAGGPWVNGRNASTMPRRAVRLLQLCPRMKERASSVLRGQKAESHFGASKFISQKELSTLAPHHHHLKIS